MADNHGDVPIGEAEPPLRRRANDVAIVRLLRRPAVKHERLLSEVARLNLAVDALAKQCALQQSLIDAEPDQLWIKDKDGAFIVVNKALHPIAVRADERHDRSDQLPCPRANQFRAIELEVRPVGIPRFDWERSVVTSSGLKKWLASTVATLGRYGDVSA